jgi:AcrR family transcriptional regulator
MSKPTPRPRNATATKTAILEAARTAFARDSFERVGVRDIADAAGVNAALVIRYFGSKEQLFAAAVTQTERGNFETLFTADLSTLGEQLARYALEKSPHSASQPSLVALLRSAPNAQAGAMLRAALETQFVRPLADQLQGEHAQLRAALIAAQIIGLAVTRNVVGSESLADGDTETLIRLAAPAFQALVDG